MSATADIATRRTRLFRTLAGRNRVVAALRIAVPGIGIAVFAALAAQIYVTSLARELGLGRISLDRSKITVETPEYAGVMSDGATYRVTAGAADAAIDAVDVISMSGVTLVMTNRDGTELIATAAKARMQTTDELVTVEGLTELTQSGGISGTLVGSVIDWPAQRLVTTGPVHFDFADGSTLDAASMDYSAADTVYTFQNVALDLPYRPEGLE